MTKKATLKVVLLSLVLISTFIPVFAIDTPGDVEVGTGGGTRSEEEDEITRGIRRLEELQEGSGSTASGADPSDIRCSPEMGVFGATWEMYGTVDIRPSVVDFGKAALLGLLPSISQNFTADQIRNCDVYISEIFPQIRGDCGGTTPEKCASLTNTMAYIGKDESLAGTQVEGTIAGLAYTLDNNIRKEPVSVNLAYFWNDSISKIPFANKALAAQVDYGHPLINVTLGVWKLVRNIALGLMSVVLLYTGIMIILRKRVNPQLVVSVQYALPKIVIGLLLIIFSYPIGAIITSLTMGLFRGVDNIVWEAFSVTSGARVASGAASLTGAGITAVVINALMGGALGLPFLVGVIVAGALALVLLLIVWIKAYLIYVKMIFSIISAPIEFAIGTIPGSEVMIANWFKRMAKYAVSMIAIGGIVPLSIALGVSLISFSFAHEAVGLGILLTVAAPLFVVLYGFGMALSIDKKVEELFEGKRGGKK